MKILRTSLFALPLLLVTLAAHDALAVRYAERPLLWNRTAVSGYAGYGLPLGNFAGDDIAGDGNHDDNWPLGWSIEVEHFVARTWSLGFSASFIDFDDQDIPELHTNTNTYSGFIRIVIPTGTEIRPYLRVGAGGVQVEFEQEGAYRFDSDYAFSFQGGAGLLFLPRRWLGINLQALYYWGDTEETSLGWDAAEYFGDDVPPIVGFDTEYATFSVGLSLFFP